MDDACRVHVFQTTLEWCPISDQDRESVRTKAHQYLVQEVLDELLFQRPRGQQPMKIRSQKFRNKVAEWRTRISGCLFDFRKQDIHVFQRRDEDIAQRDDLSTPIR
jgi:hypothetical protein